jgi:hypothetical protein
MIDSNTLLIFLLAFYLITFSSIAKQGSFNSFRHIAMSSLMFFLHPSKSINTACKFNVAHLKRDLAN